MTCVCCGSRSHKVAGCHYLAQSKRPAAPAIPEPLADEALDRLEFKLKERREWHWDDRAALLAMARAYNKQRAGSAPSLPPYVA